VEKIKAGKQKLSELKKYENIIKKKTCKKLIIFLKSKKKVKPHSLCKSSIIDAFFF
jgi:hypothetical protein